MEEEEIYTDIRRLAWMSSMLISSQSLLCMQVCGKEGWPSGRWMSSMLISSKSLLCRFVAKKASLAGKMEEHEVYADIILELVVQVFGKEGWPGGQDGGGGDLC